MPKPAAFLHAAASGAHAAASHAAALPSRLPTRPTYLWTSRRPARGFTLLRLLGVITVLGTLCALAAPILVPGTP